MGTNGLKQLFKDSALTFLQKVDYTKQPVIDLNYAIHKKTAMRVIPQGSLFFDNAESDTTEQRVKWTLIETCGIRFTFVFTSLLESILALVNPVSRHSRLYQISHKKKDKLFAASSRSATLSQISHASAETLNCAASRLPEAGARQRLHAWLCLYVHLCKRGWNKSAPTAAARSQ